MTRAELLARIVAKDARYARFLPAGEVVPTPAPAPASVALVRCGGCKGNVRVKLHEGMPVAAMVRLLRTTVPDDTWPPGFETWAVTATARAQLRAWPGRNGVVRVANRSPFASSPPRVLRSTR